MKRTVYATRQFNTIFIWSAPTATKYNSFVSGLAGISQPSPMGHQQRQQPMRNPSITIRLGARIPDNRSRRDMALATSKVQIKHFAVTRHFERSVFSSPPPLHSRQSRSAQRPSRGQSAVGSRSAAVRPRPSAEVGSQGGISSVG